MSAIKKERFFWLIFIAIMALLIMVIYLLGIAI
jgi:hypothetical protein